MPLSMLPTTPQELRALGWPRPDIVLISGDTYIDSPFIGVAVIGRVLAAAGYRVGIIAQPVNEEDIARLGEPRLFWGVSGGSVDSMVANYTALNKRRKQCDFTPGGVNDRRPDRAVIVYTNLIRRVFKNTRPIVLGGIEASLRRIAHYDYWSNRVRRSILFDAKADALLYGMAEGSVLELARALEKGAPVDSIPGLCHIAKAPPPDALILPSYEETAASPAALAAMFSTWYRHQDHHSARLMAQRHGDRFLIQNPPPRPPTSAELDRIHELPYTREPHPYYAAQGEIRAQATIRFAITTHRGCYGECHFCAIAVHQGRTVLMRGEDSIVREALGLTRHPAFTGIISDVGGPTANMYGIECPKKIERGPCPRKRCLFPVPCPHLPVDHRRQMRLLARLRAIPGVRKVFVASGVRHDLVLADRGHGRDYLDTLCRHHVSGQLKLAPEHCVPKVLSLMGKPGTETLLRFKDLFEKAGRAAEKKQFLTYYFIAAHPGCGMDEMREAARFCSRHLHIRPRQTQIFTPTPSTFSTLMYHTEQDLDGRPLFVEKSAAGKQRQKDLLVRPKERRRDKKRKKQRSSTRRL